MRGRRPTSSLAKRLPAWRRGVALVLAVAVASACSSGSPAKARHQSLKSMLPPAPGRAVDFWGGGYNYPFSADSLASDGVCADGSGTPFTLEGQLNRYDLGSSYPAANGTALYSSFDGTQTSGRPLIGLVCRSNGDVVWGAGNRILSVSDPDRPAAINNGVDPPIVKAAITQLAGTSATRSLATPVPESADAESFALSAQAIPFGERSDGSLLIIDGTVVWSLKNGRLTRIYQLTGTFPDRESEMPLGRVGTVTSGDTAYIAPWDSTGISTLGAVTGIAPDGKVTKLDLPQSDPGIAGDPARLRVWSMTSDGGSGLYVRAGVGTTAAQYVVHVHDGRIDIVAQSLNALDTWSKTLPTDMDARGIVGFLPPGIARVPGMLVLIGDIPQYGIAVGVPKS
jgi:hypothetical protein